MAKTKVVVMGGGTGIYPVVSALKELPCEIAAVVATSDSGGSTGRIRDEFGFPPVGDLRQSLAALAQDDNQSWIRKILLYRFNQGEGLKGHNLGNLILTALQDMTGSTVAALKVAEQVFGLDGQVIPVTDTSVQLKITWADGTSQIGEHILDEDLPTTSTIAHVSLTPDCVLSTAANKVLKEADLIMIGPGDYYASLMAVLVTPGIKSVLTTSKAKIIYAVNLMTRNTQTKDMTAKDHVQGIEAAIGRQVSIVLLNNQPIPTDFLKLYAHEHEFPVVDDLGNDKRVIRAQLLDLTIHQTSVEDTANRSLLRHSQAKLQGVLKDLL